MVMNALLLICTDMSFYSHFVTYTDVVAFLMELDFDVLYIFI